MRRACGEACAEDPCINCHVFPYILHLMWDYITKNWA